MLRSGSAAWTNERCKNKKGGGGSDNKQKHDVDRLGRMVGRARPLVLPVYNIYPTYK